MTHDPKQVERWEYTARIYDPIPQQDSYFIRFQRQSYPLCRDSIIQQYNFEMYSWDTMESSKPIQAPYHCAIPAEVMPFFRKAMMEKFG